jgi:hypothetical protein
MIASSLLLLLGEGATSEISPVDPDPPRKGEGEEGEPLAKSSACA